MKRHPQPLSYVELDDDTKFKDAIETLGQNLTELSTQDYWSGLDYGLLDWLLITPAERHTIVSDFSYILLPIHIS